MAQRKTLNEVQVDVLRWISEGCLDGVVADDVSARISAAALRNRGLVRTSGHGPNWKAAITAAGKEYLQQVDSPNPPLPRQPNVGVTQQLVEDVVAAGGSLRVPRRHWNEKGTVDYERRAQLAESYGKVPTGSRLVVTRVSPEELSIELVTDRVLNADDDESPSVLAPVHVPTRLSKHHPVAREFRDRTTLHEVSRKALPRVLRIVQALAVEAERRGYQVGCMLVHEDGYGRTEWKPAQDGQLVFTINEHQLKVRIWEKGAGQRGPYEHQMKRWKHDREQPFRLMQFVDRPKPYDSGATGELNIEAVGGSYGRQKSWGDRSRWILEDRLANVLRELEVQAVEAEERRLTREREQAERQRQWEAAMADAKRRLVATTDSMCSEAGCVPGRKPRRSAPTVTPLKHAMVPTRSPPIPTPSNGSDSHATMPIVPNSFRICQATPKSPTRASGPTSEARVLTGRRVGSSLDGGVLTT